MPEIKEKSSSASGAKQNKKTSNVLSGSQKGRTAVQKKSDAVVRVTKNVVKAYGKRPTRSVRIATVKKKEKAPFPTAIVFTSIMVTTLILYTIINYAQINTMGNEIAELRTSVSELQKSETTLQSKLNLRYNEANIEQIATERLGMVKSSELERKYVDLTNEDKTEIAEYDDGKGFGFLLSSFGEAIKDLFD
ncbi:MAG TPA: hypothetical protein PLT66_07230 [Bacillota bacterium]|nr:hypothetical protein [Bacillota bacterium]